MGVHVCVHGWCFQSDSGAGSSAQQSSAELQREQGTTSGEPPPHTLCHTLAKWLGPRLPQQSQFTVLHEKLTKPEEIEALSIQMFVALLTKKQDKYFVRIRPHVAARVAWHEAIADLDDLARSQEPLFEILADLAPMGSDVHKLTRARARERTTTTLDGTDHTSALAPLPQHRRHGAHTAGAFFPVPRLAVPRGLHSSVLS